MRLNQIARKLNIATKSIVAYLSQQGIQVVNKPNTKLLPEQVDLITKKFRDIKPVQKPKKKVVEPVKEQAPEKMVIDEEALKKQPALSETVKKEKSTRKTVKKKTKGEIAQSKEIIGKSKPSKVDQLTREVKVQEEHKAAQPKQEVIEKIILEQSQPKEKIEEKVVKKEPKQKKEPTPAKQDPPSTTNQPSSSDLLKQPRIKILGEITIPKREEIKKTEEKKARPRIPRQFKPSGFVRPKVQPANKDTRGSKYKKKKATPRVTRKEYKERKQEKHASRRRAAAAPPIVKVTEFISAHELAPLLYVSVMDILDICMNLGMKVSLNQRLNKEAIKIIAEELGQEIAFISIEEEMAEQDRPDDEKELVVSAPVVTVMGHVDHGKTSLLDYIRKTKITQKEAGGITQHIGAYDVAMSDGRRVVFLDTPGHKAFTAMRARGAKITDVAIIIVAANDGVKPQTKEAISHAQIAGLPIVIAINKIDHPQADEHKVKQELACINIMVEDWGGKYQCQAVSAKTGEGINDLLEKVLLEADILELKANPNKKAQGTVIEASLKKGQGYLTTVLVQQGTLKKGNILAAGRYYGKVKAMFDSHGKQLKEVGPATPVQVLGLDGAPDAGQACRVMANDREARSLANRYKNILQEQKLRSQNQVAKKKQESLFDENRAQVVPILIKGDVSGSVEALADSLLLLSDDHAHIHILYKAVGPVSESDVLLASTSEALIIGFHTTVTPQAAIAQEREKVTIKNYKIIYEAIEDMKIHIKSLAEPELKEKVVIGTAEVRKTFYISRIGTIAGCYVKEGVIKRNADIKLLRDEVVLYEGPMKQLKREKEVIKEAKADSECGISIDGFNDIKEGDIIQAIE